MNQLFVIVAIIFFPGVIATIIVDKLTVHSKWDTFKFSLYSFVFGICSYAILQILFYIWSIISNRSFKNVNWLNLNIWNVALTDKPSISGLEVVLALLLSIPVSFFISWIINFKVFNKLGQFFGITTKYGDENLYSYYLNTKEIDWIYIRDIESNLTYQGRVVSFSENLNIQEIVLYDVTVFRYNDSKKLYTIPTIYLAKKSGNFRIEEIPDNYLGEINGKKTVD